MLWFQAWLAAEPTSTHLLSMSGPFSWLPLLEHSSQHSKLNSQSHSPYQHSCRLLIDLGGSYLQGLSSWAQEGGGKWRYNNDIKKCSRENYKLQPICWIFFSKQTWNSQENNLEKNTPPPIEELFRMLLNFPAPTIG